MYFVEYYIVVLTYLFLIDNCDTKEGKKPQNLTSLCNPCQADEPNMFKIFIVLFTLSLSTFVECKLCMYCHVEFLNVYTPYCKKNR